MILGKKIWWFWVRCEGRRRRRRKQVEKLSGVLIEGVEWLLTKQFVHLI